VRLSAEERAQLDELIRRGARHQHRHYRAHWRQLVEEGFEAVLGRKYNPNSAWLRIFDGVAEAKLIALTSLRPRGFRPLEPCAYSRRGRRTTHCRARQRQHDRADATVKKRSQAASQAAMGDPAGHQRGLCRRHGRRAGGLRGRTIRNVRLDETSKH
jgi:hypothetical protein